MAIFQSVRTACKSHRNDRRPTLCNFLGNADRYDTRKCMSLGATTRKYIQALTQIDKSILPGPDAHSTRFLFFFLFFLCTRMFASRGDEHFPFLSPIYRLLCACLQTMRCYVFFFVFYARFLYHISNLKSLGE